MLNNEFYVCRVCGAEQIDPPWGEDGQLPSFDICGCCGVEFGYEDMNLESIKRFRQKWLDSGAKWFRKKDKPKDWSLEEQLRNIPEKYL